MANITTAISFSLVYPKTTGSAVTYNQLAPTWAENFTLSDNARVSNFTVAAGTSGVDILAPTFSANDHIMVFAVPESTTGDANKFIWEVKRTDSGAVVHQSISNGMPVAFSLETGDTALVIDLTDGANDHVFTVVHTRRVIS